MTYNTSLSTPHCITLIGFTPDELHNITDALRRACPSSRFDIRNVQNAAYTSFPVSVCHAIVFTPTSIEQVTTEDENTLRTTTKLGTGRIYLACATDTFSPLDNSRLDDFIQHTQAHGFEAIAEEIVIFFQEIHTINLYNMFHAVHDWACLTIIWFLKFLFPLSYLFVSLYVFQSATLLAGHEFFFRLFSIQYFKSASTFLCLFFLVHCFFVITRNGLRFVQINKYPPNKDSENLISEIERINRDFAFGALGMGLAATATAYSIAVIDQNISRIFISLVFAAGAYILFMYARRIGFESTSLSGIQSQLADSQLRIAILDAIGRKPIGSGAFSLLPVRSKTIFISYMHGSQWSSDTAHKVQQWTSERGHKVFIDKSSIPAGGLWRKYLVQSISECGIFVAVIDGKSTPSEWVVAESYYAAHLRKSIGKPRIFLVILNYQDIAKNQQNPFHIIFRDMFQSPSSFWYGATILSVDSEDLTAERFFHAMAEIRPMSLLSCVNFKQ